MTPESSCGREMTWRSRQWNRALSSPPAGKKRPQDPLRQGLKPLLVPFQERPWKLNCKKLMWNPIMSSCPINPQNPLCRRSWTSEVKPWNPFRQSLQTLLAKSWHKTRRFPRIAPPLSSHRMYELNDFRKSTHPQNRQLIVSISKNSKLTILSGSWLSKTS